MTTMLDELHQDHVNLTRLLDMLRQKVAKLREGEHPNFGLMADVIDYITNYADVHHHPREDQMYAYFRGRDAELDKAIDRCEAEHREMKHLGVELSESVDCILHDAVIPMDQFTDRLEQFVIQQTDHLNLEEGELFPKLREVASESDWAKLQQELPRPTDPLFGEKQAAQYSELYRELLSEMVNP